MSKFDDFFSEWQIDRIGDYGAVISANLYSRAQAVAEYEQEFGHTISEDDLRPIAGRWEGHTEEGEWQVGWWYGVEYIGKPRAKPLWEAPYKGHNYEVLANRRTNPNPNKEEDTNE